MITAFLHNRYYKFFTDASTFSRAKIDNGSKLLIKCMEINPEDIVLDLGCGYGPIGIVAAGLATKGKCYLVDVNKRSVDLAQENIKLNRISNAEIGLGDMFDPFPDVLFDVILTNPPISAGKNMVHSFIETSYGHLKDNGRFYLVARTRQGAKSIKEKMNETFGNSDYMEIHGGYRVIISRKI